MGSSASIADSKTIDLSNPPMTKTSLRKANHHHESTLTTDSCDTERHSFTEPSDDMYFFDLINQRLQEKSESLRSHDLERKIFISFLLKDMWIGKLHRDLRLKLRESSHLLSWFGTRSSLNLLSESARQVYADEVATDSILHTSSSGCNNDTGDLTKTELQSLLIACTIDCFFQVRSKLDFDMEGGMAESGRLYTSLRYQDNDYSSCDENDDDSSLRYTNNNHSMDEESKDSEFDFFIDPELILSSIVKKSTAEELEALIYDGSWFNNIYDIFEHLPIHLNIFQVKQSPNESNTPLTQYQLPLLFSNHTKHSDQNIGSFVQSSTPSQRKLNICNIFDHESTNKCPLTEQIVSIIQQAYDTNTPSKHTLWDKNHFAGPKFFAVMPFHCFREYLPCDSIDCMITIHHQSSYLYDKRNLFRLLDLFFFTLASIM